MIHGIARAPGIVDQDRNCPDNGNPGIPFTSIYSHRDWIVGEVRRVSGDYMEEEDFVVGDILPQTDIHMN